jgi:hypothetical protein
VTRDYFWIPEAQLRTTATVIAESSVSVADTGRGMRKRWPSGADLVNAEVLAGSESQAAGSIAR